MPTFPTVGLLGRLPPIFRLLPFLLGTSGVSIVAGFIVSKMGKYRPTIWFGGALFTIGVGLMITLDYTSSMSVFLLRNYFTMFNDPQCRTGDFPSYLSHRNGLFIPDPAIGNSSSDARDGHGYCDERLHVPSVSISCSFSSTEMTEVFSGLGCAVGLPIGEAVIASVLPRKLAAIPNIDSLGLGGSITVLNDNIDMVHLIPVCHYVPRRRWPTLNLTRMSPFVMRCYTRGRVRLQRYGWC